MGEACPVRAQDNKFPYARFKKDGNLPCFAERLESKADEPGQYPLCVSDAYLDMILSAAGRLDRLEMTVPVWNMHIFHLEKLDQDRVYVGRSLYVRRRSGT